MPLREVRWDTISPSPMRVPASPAALLVLALLGLAGPTRGQESVGAASAAPARASTGAGAADASGLLGLAEPAGGRPVLSLPDVLDLARNNAADVRIAAERVVQSEANLRRAWAAVLPTVTLQGSYTLTCAGGGQDLLTCADRTAVFADPKQLESQASLFEGIANLLTIAAGAESDPGQKQQLLDDAANLNQGAQDTRAAEQTAKPVVVQPASVFAGSLTVALPLFNGRAFPLLNNAYDSVDLSARAREQIIDALLYSTTRAYYAAVAARKLVDIAERRVDGAAKHTAATQARVEAATQPPLSLKRAQLDELRAKAELESARSGYDVAVAGLGLVVGRTEAFDVVEPSAAIALPQGTPEELADKALGSRADVAAERLTLQIAERGELDAWMMFAPSVNLVASAHATSFTSGFVTDPINGTVGITASVPLYDGGVRYAALKDAGSKIREENIRLRTLEDRVRAQVRGNARDVPVKERALAIAHDAVDVATAAHEQAQAAFDAGVGTSLDVSDTALALFVADNDLARAELDLELAKVGLAYAVGAR